MSSLWRMPVLELSYPRPDIALLNLNRPENAETLCGYGKFGVESTKQVLWANLDAPSLESALHLENRSQILAGSSGAMGEATAAFRHRQR